MGHMLNTVGPRPWPASTHVTSSDDADDDAHRVLTLICHNAGLLTLDFNITTLDIKSYNVN